MYEFIIELCQVYSDYPTKCIVLKFVYLLVNLFQDKTPITFFFLTFLATYYLLISHSSFLIPHSSLLTSYLSFLIPRSYQSTPCAIIALATFIKPAMLAPFT